MQHLSRNSGKYEWHTPPAIIASVKEVMGGIDLDPASSEAANETVGAKRFYSELQDGLLQDWNASRLFMNPPYARVIIDQWIAKLLEESMIFRRVEQWMCLVNNATDTRWAQKLLANSACVCFIAGRLRFTTPVGSDKNGPLQGQMLCYGGLPDYLDCDAFVRTFRLLGTVYDRSE